MRRWLARSIVTAIIAALPLAAAEAIPATGLIFDNENAFAASHQVPSIPDADRGVGATVSASGATPITSFALLTFQQVTGSLKFVIYDETAGAFVYKSGPESFNPDGFDGDGNANFTFKSSPVLAVTLLPGHVYDLGSMSDVENYYAYSVGPAYEQNGISSTPENVLLKNYAAPSLASLSSGDGVHGQAEFALQIQNGSAVPEPSSVGIMLIPGMAAVVFAMARRPPRLRASPPEL